MSPIRSLIRSLILGISFVIASPLWAGEFIYDTHSGERLTLAQFANTRHAGEIVVLGEEHAVKGQENDPSTIVHHMNQVRLLQALASVGSTSGFHLTTAMEFLTYTTQSYVDQFGQEKLSEEAFLQLSGWNNGNPFAFYRKQILVPYKGSGHTVALNIPQSIASHVAKSGPEGLTEDERALLPPVWERGGVQYFERFKALMEESGHIPDAAVDRYFWAQSLWDDTMAWRTLLNLTADPQALSVIIVGQFHVDFGQGLPARLARQRSDAMVKTMLQVEVSSLDDSVVTPLLQPDTQYGAHADYLWVHTLALLDRNDAVIQMIERCTNLDIAAIKGLAQ